MTTPSTIDARGRDKIFSLVLVITIGLVLVRAIGTISSPETAFAASSNDDFMRLLSVRDWLNGQSWFDMTQYRALPDEGLSLHWSRYLDLGIAAILAPLSLFLTPALAEQATMVLWPTVLSLTLLSLVAFMTRRAFGTTAAAIALIAVVIYQPLISGHFKIGRLDHHSLQIVLMTLACLALVQQDRPRRWGAIAGVAVGLSLAISLEALFLIILLSMMHVLDMVFDRQGSRPRLAAYCVTLMLSAVMLFVGQTPPAEWFLAVCDELAPPILMVAGIGSLAGLSALAVPARYRNPIAMLGVVGAVAGVGMFMTWPLTGACLQSPYANLPEETQRLIADSIIEALPMLELAERMPQLALLSFAPAITTLICATGLWMVQRATQQVTPGTSHLLAIGWLGLMVCFWQTRQVIILAAVVPAMMGYLIAHFFQRRVDAPSRQTQRAFYAIGAVTIFLPALITGGFNIASTAMASDGESALAPAKHLDANCNDMETIAALNGLEPQTILTSMNLGPVMMVATSHNALAAPYHRSDAALQNGELYRLTDPNAFIAGLDAMNTTHFVICEGSGYGAKDSIGRRLAQGETIPGFTQIPIEDEHLRVFTIAGVTE